MATLPEAPSSAAEILAGGPTDGFQVHLKNFTGPFDLLLSLISRHQLDITEVALARVTDEFIAYIRAREAAPGGWDLSEASEFLVVAATLLDLKAARLLPSGGVEDDEDLELLEARDLLFARLLQYRAYKEVAGYLAERFTTEGRRFARQVALEPQFAALLPELVWEMGPAELARLAARAMEPRPEPQVDVSHLHAPRVSVREQAAVLVDRLRRERTTSFRLLVADATERVVVVARFLAVLELYREGVVAFEQLTPLGELTLRWTGSDEGEVTVRDDYDDEAAHAAHAADGTAVGGGVAASDGAEQDGDQR